jgi:hypothetical protein
MASHQVDKAGENIDAW